MPKDRRIEAAKGIGIVATAVGSGLAINFAPDERMKAIGGVVFVGLMTYPLVKMGKDLMREWRENE